jgi:hypothetical protein
VRTYLIPFAGPFLIQRREKRSGIDHLTAFRFIFVGLVVALLLWGWILLYIVESGRWWRADQNVWFLGVVLGIGALATLDVQWARARRLDVTSPGHLAASYRARTFIGIGASEVPALAAFVGVFVMGAYWIYLVGLPVSLAGLLLAGPTRREIARRQEQIAARGSPLSLVQALMETPPPGFGRKRA